MAADMQSMAGPGRRFRDRLASASLAAALSIAVLVVVRPLTASIAASFPALYEGIALAVGPDPGVLLPVVIAGLVLVSALLGAVLEPVARESPRRAVALGVALLVTAHVVWTFLITLVAALPVGAWFLPVEAALIAFGAGVPVIGVLGLPAITVWAFVTRKLVGDQRLQ